jgi:Cu+-exporting ATPase
MATVELDIDGMSCAGCANRVEGALNKVRGVRSARVNLAIERASVDGDADPDALISAVQGVGYSAWRHEDVDPETQAARERAAERRGWLWFALSAALTLPFLVQMAAMMAGFGWTMPVWLEPLLAAPVLFLAGAGFWRGAWQSLVTRTGTMDLLVALGTGAAYFYSLGLVLTRGEAVAGQLYFEAAAVIVTLVLLGKRLESRAKSGASAAIRGLMDLSPRTAERETEDGGTETVPQAEIRVGDVLRVAAGTRIPTDATVVEGQAAVDESLITGESVPVPKRPGDSVIGGSVSTDGSLRIEASAVGRDTTLSKVVRLVERAQSGKAPVQRLVDRVSAVFVPAVVALSVVTFAGWLITGSGVETALIAAVSVLVIACPCALGLATPTALVAGTGAAARAGILIKDIDALSRAARIDTVLFDKTGTLTRGTPEIADSRTEADADADALLRAAAALQAGSTHPLAAAFRDAAEAAGGSLSQAREVKTHPGEGLIGGVDGRPGALGSRAVISRAGAALPDDLAQAADGFAEAGQTVVYFALDGRVQAVYGLSDPLRDDARRAIDSLGRAGLRVGMVSGDSRAVAERIGSQLGLDDINAEVPPDRKAQVVKDYQREGRQVAMVGDGINDAPALVQADLGIAMGSGADIALDAAPVTLMRPDLDLVPAALEVCRRTRAKIRHNLFWAFIYNVIGLPLAALGYLSPAIAGAAMAMSSVSVVTSSLLLRRWKP